MPLLKLIAENIGPFDRLELDLSDGKGNSHPGPHILAGVNGCGKSTVLKTIAAAISYGGSSGFNVPEFTHLTRAGTVAGLLTSLPGDRAYALSTHEDSQGLINWIARTLKGFAVNSASNKLGLAWASAGRRPPPEGHRRLLAAAYSPSGALRYLSAIDPHRNGEDSKASLAFESTVKNEVLQAWIVRLFSQQALAAVRRETAPEYGEFINRFEAALSEIYGQQVRLDIDTPTLSPRLRIFDQALNFSQLPGGVVSTASWICDFMMRQAEYGPAPAVILLDEVEAHLHPLWQRRLLPAIRKALPGVQIIASSHSPFAISSCPEGRVHVFDLVNGRASLRESVDAPSGDSVMTILHDIFGVSSRFDIETEKELNTWNGYLREKAVRKLNRKETAEFAKLTKRLAAKSEELRSMVSVGGLAG